MSHPSVPASILETFFPSIPAAELRRRCARRERYLVMHGDPERFTSLQAIQALRDLESVTGAYRSPAMAYGPAIVERTEGLSNRMLAAGQDALALYARGCTLEFDGADMFIPPLRRWIEALRRELELPEGTFTKAIVYASPGGGGLGAHFDAYDNFIVQLRGTKRWFLLANANAPHPTAHYDLDEQPYLPDELGSYWKGEAPGRFVEQATCEELRPGSVLFLPRGYWHATAASDEVLSVNFTLSVPTWLDLLLSEVRRRLVPHAAWRQSADGCGSDDPDRLSTIESLVADLLHRLPTELAGLRPEDVVARHREPHDVYQLATALFRQGFRF